MTIKQVCEAFGLTPDTLRYYERIGVVPPVPRSPGGIREYDAESIGWIENAICMRSADVPVERIAEYVRLYRLGDTTLAARKELLETVCSALHTQRTQLDTAIARLEYKIERCRIAVDTGILSWDEAKEE